MSAPPDDFLLAELLCARLCHDLSGPIGAAAAGAELVEDGIADPETLALVAASSAAAAARLRFFRAALTPAARPQPAGVLHEHVRAYLDAVASSSGPAISLSWRVAAAELSPDAARLLLNLVLIARDSLPRGGSLEVCEGRVEACGDAAAPPAEVGRVLDGAPPDGPRGAQAALACRLAERAGGTLAAVRMENRFALAMESGAVQTRTRRYHPQSEGPSNAMPSVV